MRMCFATTRHESEAAVRKTTAILKELKSDRAVIIRAPSTSGTIAADYCRTQGRLYLAEAVGCPWDSLWNHSIKGKMLAPRMWMGFRRTMKYADYAVYVTKEFLQRRYPSRGETAAISDVELQPMDEIILGKRMKKIQNHSGAIKIGTAGALNVAYKGQNYMIEALAKLKAMGNADYEYHLAGSGDMSVLRHLAERLGVSDQVFFDGALRHDQMFQWFDDLDVYIQPSTVESMPRALIEAMSRGLPSFGSMVGGIPELLDEDFIFPREDATAIASKFRQLSTDQMVFMSERNFEHAKQFQREILQNRRFEFYSAFAAAAKEKLK